LLETDALNQRSQSLEFDQALQIMIWRQHFIVVGISFSCPTDRALLAFLHRVHDDLPIGSSWWHVVDPSPDTAGEVCARIADAFPHARVSVSNATFQEWLATGMPELVRAELLR